MTTFVVKNKADGTTRTVLTMLSKSVDHVPTMIHSDRLPTKNYAYALAKKGSTVTQIASRMGPYAYLAEGPDHPETIKERVTKMEPNEFDFADGTISKIDKAMQNVFGWAYVTHDPTGTVNVDKSGDYVDTVEEIEKSAYDFVLESRSSDADHTNVKGGTLVESIVFTPEKIEKMGIPEGVVPLGWWVGFHIEDPATWTRVEKGELTSFSVHGTGTRQKAELD